MNQYDSMVDVVSGSLATSEGHVAVPCQLSPTGAAAANFQGLNPDMNKQSQHLQTNLWHE
jgi:hypothetical protein